MRIAGGADTVRQFLEAGVVDEMRGPLHIAPLILGEGTRLFDGLRPERVGWEPTRVGESPTTTHVRYRVR